MYASSLRELRQIMNESGSEIDVSDNSEIQTLIESITRELMLDEAYFGKGEIAEIEKVMCRIEAKIKANPFVDLYNEPESRDLDTAICKTFGFKNAHVYWARNPDITKSNPLLSRLPRFLALVMKILLMEALRRASMIRNIGSPCLFRWIITLSPTAI